MIEKHEHEQYFWTPETVNRLADFLSEYEHPCCICAPTVGAELARRGKTVTNLDRDTRFAECAGFRAYDLYRPEYLAQRFDILLCDPPFFGMSLAQLFHGLRILAHYDFSQPLLVAYLARRAANIEGTFTAFGLRATGVSPAYVTVQNVERNQIELFSNLSEPELARLVGCMENADPKT
jgi:hypothetical protein